MTVTRKQLLDRGYEVACIAGRSGWYVFQNDDIVCDYPAKPTEEEQWAVLKKNCKNGRLS